MNDETSPTAASAETGHPSGTRGIARRWGRRAVLLATALLTGLCITFFSIDLGPSLRELAERQGSNYLERPLHIGKLKALIWPGAFELDDVIIEGLNKGDQPFLSTKKIVVAVTWRTLLKVATFQRELFIEVRMTDWKMAIEKWPDGRQSLPKIMPQNKSTGKKPFTVTATFIYADRGEFTFIDHGIPWKVVAPNLNFDLVRSNALGAYVGVAHLSSGAVQIQDFLPMATKLTTRFTIDGSIVRLHQIDLLTDGAKSSVQGYVDFSRWPEQKYDVKSQLDFARMRELFFANEKWRVAGASSFDGTFHLFKDGYQLKGQFASPLATLNTPNRTLLFPKLRGSLEWAPGRFTVTDAGADFYGGEAKFAYTLAPLGTGHPAGAEFIFDYDTVDLPAFLRGIAWTDMDPRGRASGHHDMTWVNGQWGATVVGRGSVTVTPPDGIAVAGSSLPTPRRIVPPEPAPFNKDRPLGPLPIGGVIGYRLDPDGIEFDPSWAASPSSYVSFHGRADYGQKSNLPFHVTSADWQESDRVLVAILTAAGSPASAVAVAGRGGFDGVMTESFSSPRIAGAFTGEAVRTWDVTWGRVVGDIVIQNRYVTVTNGVIGDTPQSTIRADGLFSLGYPRTDHGEEIHARVRVDNWDLEDFRHAFGLDDWPITGVIGSADIQLTGAYTGPFGTGDLRIDRGTAWREAFDTVHGDLTFNGVGLQISRIAMAKGPGLVNGSAFIKWDGSYSFDAQGDKIPVETLTSITVPKAPLSGVLSFKSNGAGEFASPAYEFSGTVEDLFAGDQGIGAVSAVLLVRNKVLIIQGLEARSMRLQVSGSGSVALNDAMDAKLTFRFSDTSIDPYLPFVAPSLAPRLSPYTRARIGGLVQVQGALENPAALSIVGTISQANLTLFDYDLHNDGDIVIQFVNNVATISRFKLAGEGTSLELSGDIPRSGAPMALTARGDANLEILKVFSPDFVGSGTATVNATIEGGSLGASPSVAGQAVITSGRLRYRDFPGVDQINGPITFGPGGIGLAGIRGRMGEGDVAFGGSISLKNLVPDEFDLSMKGRNMRLRFPVGFASTVDADLTLTGPVGAATLGGDVTVLKSVYQPAVNSDVADLLAMGSLGSAPPENAEVSSGGPSSLTLDVHVGARNTLTINTRDVQIVGSANLNFRGTFDHPSMTGLVSIGRGKMFLNGNRYDVQPGTIDFSNPSKIEPFLDVAAETKARVTTQTYNVTIRLTGTLDKLNPTFTSDPYLPTPDLISVLLGEVRDPGMSERRAVGTSELSQQAMMRTAGLQLMTMAISSRVGSVVERTIPFDTFSIVPLLGDDAAFQQLSPGARITLGKRISDRVFLTYSHQLNPPIQVSDVLLLEYEQSERVSWVLSQNEDRTFSLDFRIRHTF